LVHEDGDPPSAHSTSTPDDDVWAE